MADLASYPETAGLTPLTPCAGLLPITLGGLTLAEVAPGPMALLAPRAEKGAGQGSGQGAALAAALAAQGLGWPAPGQALESGAARLCWFDHDHALWSGAPLPEGLAPLACITDQSDAWAVVDLTGAGACDVLARVMPLDLRARAFAPGTVARSDLQHMPAHVTRLAVDGFRIMVFRSMARTLVHDLHGAMKAVQARRG